MMSSVSTQSGTHPQFWKSNPADSHAYDLQSKPSQYPPSHLSQEANMASPPHPHYPMQPQHFQPAPRQRTAIACRYCRRRKIRCSGFETSADARCSNCIRFHQECVFTPVSSQTQAFVPVQAIQNAMRGEGGPPGEGQYQQVYGAYGQPLGHVNIGSHYAHPPHPGHPQGPPPPDASYRLPPPPSHAPQSPSTMHPPGGYYEGYDPRNVPHLPNIQTSQSGSYPPIVPRSGADYPPYHAEAGGYQGPPPGQPGYYPSNAPPGRYYESGASGAPPSGPASSSSAPSPYPYNGERSSASPNSAAQFSQQGLRPPPPSSAPQQPPSPQPQGGPTSPRSGVPISSILDGGKPGGVSRSTTDRSMLDALNRKI